MICCQVKSAMGDIQGYKYEKLLEVLREERKSRNLTQNELATRLGKRQAYVSKYERGDTEISLLDYFDIAHAIGFEPLALLEILVVQNTRVDKLFKKSNQR